jgi:hypothetical protein
VKILFLKLDYRQAIGRFEGQFPDPSHVDQTVEVDTKVIAPNGSIIAVMLYHVIQPAVHKLAYRLWKTVDELPSNRATAVGSLSLPRIKRDGTLGKRRGTPEPVLKALARQGAAQGSLGYLDATPDQPCHKTQLTRRQPKKLDDGQPLIKLVDALYKEYLPTFYAKQRSQVKRVPHWRLWNTAFTTIYLAKNFRTAYHRDSGNLLGVMTALMPMGDFTGGELVLPRWRIAFALQPSDLLFFDPQQLHGNLPFEGDRLSSAFYCERRIADCEK